MWFKRGSCIIWGLRRSHTSHNITEIQERGILHAVFPDTGLKEVIRLCSEAPQTVYAGFDPTADSLHIGNLVVVLNLLHWQRAGHRPIALIGNATAKIGDPSGRTKERDPMLADTIDRNSEQMERIIRRIFHNHREYFHRNLSYGLPDLIVLNNESWYNSISAIELIGGMGRRLRMGMLLSRTSVQNRLQSPAGMSFTEFSYQLFQAYDWLHLFRTYNCRFQVGGSDQTGNLMSGHELISKEPADGMSGSLVYGLTSALVTNEVGDKYGKSSGSPVWLSAERTSPFALYQYFLRCTDTDVARMLRLFTMDALEPDIRNLLDEHHKQPEARLAQKRLAHQLTLLVHGPEGVASAVKASQALYDRNLDALADMTAPEIGALVGTGAATVVQLASQDRDQMHSLLDLAMKARCFPTQNDAVRIIKAGGFSVNHQRASDPMQSFNIDACRLKNDITLLRVGKRNCYVVQWNS